MNGTLYIDGIDIYSEFGVFITEGGYKGLLSFPKMKEPDKNDWHEYDGTEVDLSSPKLDTKTFSVSFAGRSGVDEFMNFLLSSVTHSFNFVQVGLSRTLRLVSFTEYKGCQLKDISVEFADDNPLSGYSYVDPSSSLVSQRGYKIDNIDLSTYGICILEGSDAEIQKPFSVKPNLTRSSKYMSGIVYDTGFVAKQTKEVKLNCLMQANNLTELWKNYNAMLFNLTKPSARVFGFGGSQYQFYYKSSSVSDISLNGKLWLVFDLSLIFTKQL